MTVPRRSSRILELPRLRIILFSISELEAVHDRHREVEQDQIGQGERCANIQAFAPVRRGPDGIAFVLEQFCQRFTNRAIVIDD